MTPTGPSGARVTSRPYAADDLEPCLDVFDTNVPEFFRPEERREYEAFLRALPGPYLLVLDEDEAVLACGGYAVTDGGATADLCWGMVRRTAHGRGYGRTLTRLRIERIIADTGVREIAMNTSQHTVGFYERLGFRTTRIRENGYGPGLHRCDMRLAVVREPSP